MNAVGDAVTVFQKELLELAEDWQSARAALAQTAIMILFLGVYLPSMNSALWSNTFMIGTIFFVFPALLAATVASDAFAGERERGTLETLLATPVSDGALFFGKACWSVAYSFVSATAALLCGLLTTVLVHGSIERYVPAIAVVAAVGDAFVATVFTSAVATLISSKTVLTKTATQASRIVALLSGAVLLALTESVSRQSGWGALFMSQLVLFLASGFLIAVSAAHFRRDRILARR